MNQEIFIQKERRSIYNNELLFIEQGNSMSHWEFCLNKLNLTKDNFNKLTRGYYLNGDIVFYKNNFAYDEGVIKEEIKYINQIKKALKMKCTSKSVQLLGCISFGSVFYIVSF